MVARVAERAGEDEWISSDERDRMKRMGMAEPRAKALIGAVAIVLLGFLFLVSRLDAVALSGDEIGNVLIETGGLTDIFESTFTARSQHPPGSHFIMLAGLRLFGATDYGARVTSVFISTLGLVLMYRLVKGLSGWRTALWSAFTLATASTFILYGRMEKYYALQLCLSLLVHVQFFSWLEKRSFRRLLAYGLLLTAMWYTDYLAAGFVVAIHFLWLLLAGQSRWPLTLNWMASTVASLALFIPWLPVLRTQAVSLHNSTPADLATGVVGFAAKLTFFLYSYGIGETVFPWEIPSILSALVVAVLMAALIWRLPRLAASQKRALLFGGLGFAVPAIGLTILSCTPILATVPLLTLPNHVIFALPLFRLLLVGGLDTGRWRRAALIALGVLAIPAIVNIYRGDRYLNPAHANPSRETVAYLVRAAQPRDIVIADEAILFSYYLNQYEEREDLVFIPADSSEAARIPFWRIDRLWVITIGRDRTRGSAPTDLLRTIESYMHPVVSRGFGEQDSVYRALKQRLTGREAYQYRVVVRLYQS
jgi:hypothetical protein